MEFKKIYNLLDTGWIYVKFNNEYFNKAFISHIPKKYVKKIDNYIFVKKSKSVYESLNIMGMNMEEYDSIVLIDLKKENDKISIDYETIDIPENLLNITKRILDNRSKY